MTVRQAAAIRWASFALIARAVLLVMRAAPTERILDLAQIWINGLGVWGPVALGGLYILRLELQLAEQSAYAHSHPRWFHFDTTGNVVQLTALYDWYGGDFTREVSTVVEYAAGSAPALRQAIAAGHTPRVRWLDYDWRLNSRRNRQYGSVPPP